MHSVFIITIMILIGQGPSIFGQLPIPTNIPPTLSTNSTAGTSSLVDDAYCTALQALLLATGTVLHLLALAAVKFIQLMSTLQSTLESLVASLLEFVNTIVALLQALLANPLFGLSPTIKKLVAQVVLAFSGLSESIKLANTTSYAKISETNSSITQIIDCFDKTNNYVVNLNLTECIVRYTPKIDAEATNQINIIYDRFDTLDDSLFAALLSVEQFLNDIKSVILNIGNLFSALLVGGQLSSLTASVNKQATITRNNITAIGAAYSVHLNHSTVSALQVCDNILKFVQSKCAPTG